MLHKKIEREHYEQKEKFYRKVTNVKLLEEPADIWIYAGDEQTAELLKVLASWSKSSL